MRPTFEIEKDLQHEREIAELLARRSGFTPVKNKPFYPADWSFLKGDLLWGVAEIKCRNKHYDQMMLSLEKVQKLREFAASGIEVRAVFATPEGVYVKKIGPEGVDGWIGIGGRADRGDPADREPVVYFSPFIVGGVVYKEEKEPMVRVADSDPRWFE